MIFSKNSTINQKKKRFVTEEITKFDYIFDTKDFILCIVCDEIVDKNDLKI